MWIRTENDSVNKPEKIRADGRHVIIRKNFVLVDATEEKPSHWEFDEWQMAAEQYEVYRDFEGKLEEQDDALIELASLISEVIG